MCILSTHNTVYQGWPVVGVVSPLFRERGKGALLGAGAKKFSSFLNSLGSQVRNLKGQQVLASWNKDSSSTIAKVRFASNCQPHLQLSPGLLLTMCDMTMLAWPPLKSEHFTAALVTVFWLYFDSFGNNNYVPSVNHKILFLKMPSS